ncbi:MAG TPA: hypothetical protein VK621_21265, partial [Bradyrhizobium sp.]|nr:hypothetical protein [Bradyrhizobium sp.]
KAAPLWGVQFDFAAFTAVLTTVAGAVLAHVEASRFDFLVTTYLATARGLRTGVIVHRSRGRILSTIVKAFLRPKIPYGS